MALLRKGGLIAALLLGRIVGLAIGERQYFRVAPSNTSVVEGETALMKCVVSNQRQQGQTYWTKDGVTLGYDYNSLTERRYRMVGSPAIGEYNLQIANAKLEDVGEFECQVLPTMDESDGLRAVGHLEVLVAPKGVARDGDQSSVVEARAGRAFVQECRALPARPKATVRWYKDGVLIDDKAKVTETSEGDDKLFTSTSRLRWKAEAEDDGSLFTCQATHPALQADKPLSVNFTLAVHYPPSFPEIRGYDGRTLTAGERLRLECVVANGNPVPVVIWHRNGHAVDSTYVTLATSSVNEYEFAVNATDHDASYTCQTTNVAAVAPLSSSVRLSVFYAPSNVEISGQDSARLGQAISLSCQSGSSNPPAKIIWTIDGKPTKENLNIVRPTTGGSVKGFVTSSNITINATNERRDVNVVCSAVNEEVPAAFGGRTSLAKIINILYPPESVTVFGYDGTPLKAGTVHRLTCVSSGGNPLPSVSWFRGRRRITTGVVRTVADSVVQSELTFTVNRSDNQAIYKCVAENSVSTKPLVAVVNLTVHFAPAFLNVNVKPVALRVGDIAHIVCESASGNPAPLITWLRGRETAVGMDVHNKSGAHGGWLVKSKLYVPLTADEDGMSYTCRASSAAVGQTINEMVSLSVRYPPIFYLTEPQRVTVLENETVLLNATAYANPDSISYEWMKDGQAVRNSFYKSTRPKVQLSGALMTFYEIDRAHAGHYSCRAQNSEGSTELTFAIQVRHSAEISHITRERVVSLGESVELSCEAKAFPITESMVSWYRNNYNMSRTIQVMSNGKAFLRINDTEAEDAGSFTCVAYNGIGVAATQDSWVIVKHAPLIDKTTAYSKSASEIDAQAVLRCVARGGTDISWQWQKSSGQQLEYGVRLGVQSKQLNPLEYEVTRRCNVVPKQFGYFKSKLIINKVEKEDFTRYKCIARNDFGTDEFDIPLIHLSVPDAPSDIRIVNVTHDTVTLRWRPTFDGGLPQHFVIRYYSQHSPERQLTVKAVNETFSTVTGLVPATRYFFTVESTNRLGTKGSVSGQYVQAETNHIRVGGASQHGIKEDIPVMVIVLVCFVGVVLLALNAILVMCFIKRHRNRKLQVPTNGMLIRNNVDHSPSLNTDSTLAEKAANVRLLEQNAAGAVHCSTLQKMQNGSGGNLEREAYHNVRPLSQFSDDSVSMRTVVEVDSAGRQTIGRHYGAVNQPTYFNYQSADDYNDTLSDALYAESLRANDIQRQLASPNFCDPSFQAVLEEDFMAPLMGPLRSISQEIKSLSGYQDYPNLNSPTFRRPLGNSGSPICSRPMSSLPPARYSSRRSPYCNVRPNSRQQSSYPAAPSSSVTKAPGVNSPLLSTFSANSAVPLGDPDFAIYDGGFTSDVV